MPRPLSDRIRQRTAPTVSDGQLTELARACRGEAISTLLAICRDDTAQGSARAMAASRILEISDGKPGQSRPVLNVGDIEGLPDDLAQQLFAKLFERFSGGATIEEILAEPAPLLQLPAPDQATPRYGFRRGTKPPPRPEVPAGWDDQHLPHIGRPPEARRVSGYPAIRTAGASQERDTPVWRKPPSDPVSPTQDPPSASADAVPERPVVAGHRFGLAEDLPNPNQPPGGIDPDTLRQSAQPVHRPERLDPFENSRTLFYGRMPVGRLH